MLMLPPQLPPARVLQELFAVQGPYVPNENTRREYPLPSKPTEFQNAIYQTLALHLPRQYHAVEPKTDDPPP